MAIERALSSDRLISSWSTVLPVTPAIAVLFCDEMWFPERLTSADVISYPEVRSALSFDERIARDKLARSTTPPFRIPRDGASPTPITRCLPECVA